MKDYNNELLNDCAWFAEKHRGKNKQSGAHWSTIIRFPKLFDEAVRLQKENNKLKVQLAASESATVLHELSEMLKNTQVRVQELEAEHRWIHQDKTMIVKKDGDSWCAVMPDFEDLQESESRWFNGTVNQYMDAVYGYLKESE